jgi:hypothetical protein
MVGAANNVTDTENNVIHATCRPKTTKNNPKCNGYHAKTTANTVVYTGFFTNYRGFYVNTTTNNMNMRRVDVILLQINEDISTHGWYYKGVNVVYSCPIVYGRPCLLGVKTMGCSFTFHHIFQRKCKGFRLGTGTTTSHYNICSCYVC